MIGYTVRVSPSGHKFWWLNGKLHREDGPAIEYGSHKEWWLNNERHREDGPAIEWANGDKYWYSKGNLHREDGPAYEGADGTKEWWLSGKRVTEEEHKRLTSPTVEMTVAEISKALARILRRCVQPTQLPAGVEQW